MKDEKGGLGTIEQYLEDVNKKLPPLPKKAVDVISQYMPWIILIVAVLMIPAILAVFSVNALFGPASYYGAYYAGTTRGSIYYISWIFSMVAFVLEIIAIKGLMARKISAWRMVFWATLISAIGTLLTGEIFSFIISLAIGLYILFQIKQNYK